MIFIGMIYQYDSEQGSGLLMLSDGEKKEFRSNDWVDTNTDPAVGQKIAYKVDANKIQIKIASDEDITQAEIEKEKHSQKEDTKTNTLQQFTNVDECIEYYSNMGFKLVKDTQNDGLRTITLRIYTPADYGEAVIKDDGSKISIIQTINGKQEVFN